MQLNLTSLKYKEKTSLDSGDIDWRKICEENEQRKLYNKYLLELTSRDMTYDTFCEAVTRAGRETAVSIESKCEGWYKASESILIPAIEEKNRLRHRLQDKSNLNDDEITDLQLKLKQINKRNHDLVDLAKAHWYSGIVPTSTTCDSTHASHGKISTCSPAAKLHTTKPTSTWP
jgi:hypothetical protein